MLLQNFKVKKKCLMRTKIVQKQKSKVKCLKQTLSIQGLEKPLDHFDLEEDWVTPELPKIILFISKLTRDYLNFKQKKLKLE